MRAAARSNWRRAARDRMLARADLDFAARGVVTQLSDGPSAKFEQISGALSVIHAGDRWSLVGQAGARGARGPRAIRTRSSMRAGAAAMRAWWICARERELSARRYAAAAHRLAAGQGGSRAGCGRSRRPASGRIRSIAMAAQYRERSVAAAGAGEISRRRFCARGPRAGSAGPDAGRSPATNAAAK